MPLTNQREIKAEPSLLIGYHPPSLSLNDLDILCSVGFRAWKTAPQFGSWLVKKIQAEQTRRLEVNRGTYLEVDSFALPSTWSNEDLSQALPAATAISYAVSSFEAGRFADKLVISLNALVALRLTEKEIPHAIA